MVVSTGDSSLSSWLDAQLSQLLGFPSTQEITEYVLSMEEEQDREAYLMEMLDRDNPEHRRVVREFLERSRGPKGVKVYRKKPDKEVTVTPDKKKTSSPPKSAEKSKPKFSNLYSEEGARRDVVLLKGRRPCECQAARHDLVSNCTSCGRVVCAQEGSGPCLFCGALVATREEREVLGRNSRKSEQLLKKLLGPENKVDEAEARREAALKKAREHKERLLEFDKTCEKRTQVIDDESDYFSVDGNQWLSSQQRDALRKREDELRKARHGSRLEKKITFDFAGRRVVEEENALADYDPSKDEVVKGIMGGGGKKGVGAGGEGPTVSLEARRTLDDTDGAANPFLDWPRPQLVASAEEEQRKRAEPKASNVASSAKFGRRLQDRELQEMGDDGVCLSMHQPYASLLVCGIKRDEGRTWYSPVRGRLWIHAAAKVPTEEEVAEVKRFYKDYYQDDKIPFPSAFPSGCLLGCVDVVDCLSQEDYRDLYPKGESASNFVFVCANPKELLVKFPMQGQHKIYKLDSSIHQAAKKAAKKGTS